jgi:hypothetical protein
MSQNELIIKDTHRALWYEDGVVRKVLEAGRYELPKKVAWPWKREPKVEVVLVDVREREITIKGQEILTSDKVAIRVSIIVQFRVVDPKAAVHQVANFEERLYSDVQLSARRSLASMNLEEILTNRNRSMGSSCRPTLRGKKAAPLAICGTSSRSSKPGSKRRSPTTPGRIDKKPNDRAGARTLSQASTPSRPAARNNRLSDCAERASACASSSRRTNPRRAHGAKSKAT